MWKKRFIVSLWWLLGIAMLGLLVAAMREKGQLLCKDVKIDIEGAQGHVFVDERDILQLMKNNGAAIGKAIRNIHLKNTEAAVKNNPWIKDAELFFDNNNILHAKLTEREPLARIFTLQNTSFYIDSSGLRLPLSNDYSARVPMFTSFTSNRKKLSKPDSLLLNDVKKIARFISNDSFWTAQTAQVNITPQRTFNIIPVFGNQTIELGNADSLLSKFNRLIAFYKQVWVNAGFEKYETISVAYTGQVVATRRGAPKPVIDSLLAVQITNNMHNGAGINRDSLKSVMYMPVPAKDSTKIFTAKPMTASVNNKPKQSNVIHNKPLVMQNTKSRVKNTVKEAKAVMQKSKRKQ